MIRQAKPVDLASARGKQISCARIDTYENNKIMQYLIEKRIQKCSIIYMNNGSPRIVY
jgi:hypothetical protein